MHPPDPDDLLPDDVAFTAPGPEGRAHELLDLTWQFLIQASAQVQAELGMFLTQHGWNPRTGPSAYLDCLQLTAFGLTPGGEDLDVGVRTGDAVMIQKSESSVTAAPQKHPEHTGRSANLTDASSLNASEP